MLYDADDEMKVQEKLKSLKLLKNYDCVIKHDDTCCHPKNHHCFLSPHIMHTYNIYNR